MLASIQTNRAMYRIATVFCALLCPIVNRESRAQTSTEHPYIDPGKIKRETCLNCHPDKVEGKFVHAAAEAGCDNCHTVASAKARSTVTSVSVDGGVCTGCHEVKKSPVVHFPYKTGQCLVCHNPHASAFPGITRAAIGTLCMSCHGSGSPDVKIDRANKMVSLLGGRTIDVASYERAPKVGVEHSEKSKSHPLTKSAGAKLDCLSCHNPHSSEVKNLLNGSNAGWDASESTRVGGNFDRIPITRGRQ